MARVQLSEDPDLNLWIIIELESAGEKEQIREFYNVFKLLWEEGHARKFDDEIVIEVPVGVKIKEGKLSVRIGL